MASNASFIDPNLLAQYSSYFDPSAFNPPSNAGPQGGSGGISSLGSTLGDVGGTAGAVAGGIIDPIGSLISSIFGGGGSSFKPYVDANGNYVWTNPKKANPVPVADTPGATLKPSAQYKAMASNIQALVDLLPSYTKAVSGQVIPNAQAQLTAEQATSPGLAQLMTELYGQYGPQLNAIGSQIGQQNAVAQVGSDTAALNAANSTLIPAAKAAAEQYDPEYFKTRTNTSNAINDLLSNPLSTTEQRAISQGLAREDSARGNANAPSQIDTVGNAMKYGNAARTNLEQAIGAATAAIPALKSGTDVFQVATGRSSTPNPGNANFTGVNNASGALNNASAMASGLLNNTTSTQQNNAQLQLQSKLNTKDWADYLGQVTSSIGNITGSLGSVAGMCWIARRVYGINNPLWLQFRDFVMNKAPSYFREFYSRFGEQIASKLTDSQVSKLKPIFDQILKESYQHVK